MDLKKTFYSYTIMFFLIHPHHFERVSNDDKRATIYCSRTSNSRGIGYALRIELIEIGSILPFTAELKELALIATSITNTTYNAAFVNLYRNGDDFIPHHRDVLHGIDAPITSFSLYEHGSKTTTDQLRKLEIIEKATCKDAPITKTTTIVMTGRSAVVMWPGIQQRATHSVLADSAVSSHRINVTFRLRSTKDDV
jgi:hypothetical protein